MLCTAQALDLVSKCKVHFPTSQAWGAKVSREIQSEGGSKPQVQAKSSPNVLFTAVCYAHELSSYQVSSIKSWALCEVRIEAKVTSNFSFCFWNLENRLEFACDSRNVRGVFKSWTQEFMSIQMMSELFICLLIIWTDQMLSTVQVRVCEVSSSSCHSKLSVDFKIS